MKCIALIMVAALTVTSVCGADFSVDDLRDANGKDYKKLLEDKVEHLPAGTLPRANADAKERILLDIVKSRKATPQTYVELDEIIHSSRQKREGMSAKQRGESINARSTQLMQRILGFAGQRGGKFKSEAARLALVESLWKLVEDDYERLNFVLALSEFTSLDEDLLPIVTSVLHDTKHPDVIKHTLLLLAKFDATFTDAKTKEDVRNALAGCLSACAGDPDCRNVCRVMLQKIGGEESAQLIEALESSTAQETQSTEPAQEEQDEDIVVDVP